MYLRRWSDFDGEREPSFAALDELSQAISELFEDTGGPLAGLARDATTMWPRCNLYDSGSELVVFAAVPGLSDKEIQINATGDMLSISGKRRLEVPEKCSIHREERGQLEFARTFSLPCKIDVERTSATVKDGMLTVRLTKSAEAQPRQISVEASA